MRHEEFTIYDLRFTNIEYRISIYEYRLSITALRFLPHQPLEQFFILLRDGIRIIEPFDRFRISAEFFRFAQDFQDGSGQIERVTDLGDTAHSMHLYRLTHPRER